MARPRKMSAHAWVRPCTSGSGIWHSFVTIMGKTERLSAQTKDRDKAVTFNLLHLRKVLNINIEDNHLEENHEQPELF